MASFYSVDGPIPGITPDRALHVIFFCGLFAVLTNVCFCGIFAYIKAATPNGNDGYPRLASRLPGPGPVVHLKQMSPILVQPRRYDGGLCSD